MASDESSMSSGSRMQQFGLYRTIDARTEEFLRLSRKRQIRQGCACAAASTAITVTVVIVIFFVYEFSLNSGTTLEHSLKSGWLSLMNDTSEDTLLDPKITKTNIDKTTLKLLPLLIKAIKKNVVLEKLLSDQTNSNSIYDKKEDNEANEDGSDQNLMTNWLKLPTTKLFAMEYKTSPVVYYKDPTKSIAYYTKIRKIRDYKRVLNYVDKMISDKVYIRSSRPMQKEEINTESSFQIKFLNHSKSLINHTLTNYTRPYTNVHKNYVNLSKVRCKCPQDLQTLLKKVLTNLEKILPETILEPKFLDCQKNKTVESNQVNTTISHLLNLFTETPIKKKMNRSFNNEYSYKPHKTKSKLTWANLVSETTNGTVKNFKPDNKIEPRSAVKKTILKNLFEDNLKTKQYSQKLNEHQTFFNKYKTLIHKKQIMNPPKPKTKSSAILEPIFDGIEYDDYGTYTSTPSTIPLKNNQIHYVDTKVNYLNDIILPNKKKVTEEPMSFDYKKVYKPASFKKFTVSDLHVVDNKIALVKSKPSYLSKTNTNRNYNSISLHKIFNGDSVTSLPNNNIGKATTDEQITLNLYNSSISNPNKNSNQKIGNDKIKLSRIENAKGEFITLKPTYFKYLTNNKENKTIFSLLKYSLHTYLNKTMERTAVNSTNFNVSHDKIDLSLKKTGNLKKENNTLTQLLIENLENILLRKNLTKIAKSKKNAIIQKLDLQKISSYTSDKPNLISTLKPFSNTTTIYRISNMSENDNKIENNEIVITPANDIATLNSYEENYFKEEKTPINVINTSVRNVSKELSDSRDSFDDTEFLITEITKLPENTIPKDNNTLLYNKTHDLTWEDLNSEVLPTWKSVVADANVLRVNKSQYYKKNYDKEDHQEEDFSINGNFYDLNM